MSFIFRSFPVLRNMAIYAVLYPSANIVQQTLILRVDSLDFAEVFRFAIYGGLFHAPLVYSWLGLAARMFPKNNITHLFAKVLLDQLCFAPVALSAFYVVLCALERKSRARIYDEWRQKFPKTWATGACIWPILTAINFRFVPASQRTAFVGACGFFWDVFVTKNSEK